MTGVRRSPFAGEWYPDDPGELSRMVETFLERAPAPALDGRLHGLVCPHAGLRYSGPVAAAAYRLLRGGDYASAVLIGPSHRVFFDALAIYPDGAFETPLGRVAVDSDLATALGRAEPRCRFMPEVHQREHCLEMQLPFLQHVVPGCRIVPVMMGSQSPENIEAAARAIETAVTRLDRPVLLVASSDLSHYQPRERARALDGQVLEGIERFDAGELMRLVTESPHHACGGGPIVSVMLAARSLGALSAKVLAYGDSGDTTGDTDAVVGYAAAAFAGGA